MAQVSIKFEYPIRPIIIPILHPPQLHWLQLLLPQTLRSLPHKCCHLFPTHLRPHRMYNAPNNAQSGVLESCEGDNQDFPGVYYTTNDAFAGGIQTVTYNLKQPAESLGPITSIPYTPRVPASSNCVTYTSAMIYASELTVTAPGDASSSATSGNGSATGKLSEVVHHLRPFPIMRLFLISRERREAGETG